MALPVRNARTDLSRWNPVREFDRLTQQMSRFYDEQWSDITSAMSEGFIPMADLEETDDAYLLDVELPGVERKDIDIDLAGRRLVISGERKEKERTGWLRSRTRSWGRFRYEVVLGTDVDEEGVEATLQDGELRIRIPKSPAAQRRRIEVK